MQGVGTLWGLRLDPDNHGLHLRVRAKARQRGVAVYTEGQTINGKGNFVLLAPPYTISQNELSEGLHRLMEVINETT